MKARAGAYSVIVYRLIINSVDKDRVGTASGVNNAVARVASVLAIAVLGIVMVKAFGFRLNSSLAHFLLPPAVVHELQANKIKLGGLQAPATLNPSTKTAIDERLGTHLYLGSDL